MTIEEKTPRKMPKGGRKGGAIFPRIPLQEAVGYARKLVSKTHTAAQPRDVIYSGVVGAKSGLGDVKISALKQYGFVQGDAKVNYSAAELAKKIVAAPDNELSSLYQKAVLRPTVFKSLFDTFHGDIVSKAKLKQRAADLNVHPDESEKCIEIYVSGLMLAGLAKTDGDRVTLVAAQNLVGEEDRVSTSEDSLPTEDLSEAAPVSPSAEPSEAIATAGAAQGDSLSTSIPTNPPDGGLPVSPKAIFNVNVTLDSSLDTEKLQKQLELLKRFGAI